MYWIGRPWIPPLSFTHWKYAAAILATVVKSTPGMSMLSAPILIGAPVAFLPVPKPHTAFDALALPEPTGAAADVEFEPVARAASTSVATPTAASAIPPLSLVDLNSVLLLVAPHVRQVRAVGMRLACRAPVAAAGQVCA